MLFRPVNQFLLMIGATYKQFIITLHWLCITPPNYYSECMQCACLSLLVDCTVWPCVH